MDLDYCKIKANLEIAELIKNGQGLKDDKSESYHLRIVMAFILKKLGEIHD